MLRMSQHRAPEALSAFSRAARLAPDDFTTMYLSAMSQIRVDPTGVRDRLPETLATLTSAVKLNGAASDGYAALAYLQMLSKDTLPAATTSITHAIALAPGRLDYLTRYADIQLLSGNVAEARKMLEGIAAVKTDAKCGDMRAAAVRLEAINANARQLVPELPASAADASHDPDVAEGGGASDASRGGGAGGAFRLRSVRPGESRVFGRLMKIECAAGSVRFVVEADGRTVTAGAPAFSKLSRCSRSSPAEASRSPAAREHRPITST